MSSCVLPSFNYLPPSLSQMACMEMEHESSMAQVTHVSMLHDDDILASNIDDQPIYQAIEFSQAKEDDEV